MSGALPQYFQHGYLGIDSGIGFWADDGCDAALRKFAPQLENRVPRRRILRIDADQNLELGVILRGVAAQVFDEIRPCAVGGLQDRDGLAPACCRHRAAAGRCTAVTPANGDYRKEIAARGGKQRG